MAIDLQGMLTGLDDKNPREGHTIRVSEWAVELRSSRIYKGGMRTAAVRGGTDEFGLPLSSRGEVVSGSSCVATVAVGCQPWFGPEDDQLTYITRTRLWAFQSPRGR